MHIIEPTPKRRLNKKIRARRQKTTAILLFLLVILGMAGLAYRRKISDVMGSNNTTSRAISAITTGNPRFISGNEFQEIYNHTAYPNTKPIPTTPQITNNPKLDDRIARIAESRGYRLQAIPPQGSVTLSRVHDDLFAQQSVVEPLQLLLIEAEHQKIQLVAKSGFQSLETQKEQFNNQLKKQNVDYGLAAEGNQDEKLVTIIEAVSPPGYTRLHTGYALRLGCKTNPDDFASSPCHTWLSSQNYANAKKQGFIPSYAEGVGTQSPKNEAEYVWVGTSHLY